MVLALVEQWRILRLEEYNLSQGSNFMDRLDKKMNIQKTFAFKAQFYSSSSVAKSFQSKQFPSPSSQHKSTQCKRQPTLGAGKSLFCETESLGDVINGDDKVVISGNIDGNGDSDVSLFFRRHNAASAKPQTMYMFHLSNCTSTGGDDMQTFDWQKQCNKGTKPFSKDFAVEINAETGMVTLSSKSSTAVATRIGRIRPEDNMINVTFGVVVNGNKYVSGLSIETPTASELNLFVQQHLQNGATLAVESWLCGTGNAGCGSACFKTCHSVCLCYEDGYVTDSLKRLFGPLCLMSPGCTGDSVESPSGYQPSDIKKPYYVQGEL